MHVLSHRDNINVEPADTPFDEEVPENMFTFWNDFLHEKFAEEGDGVLLVLERLERTITGQL